MEEVGVYLYLPKEIADKVNEAKDKKKIQEEYILKWVEEQKKDIKNSVDALEDDLITFKAVAIKHKNALKEIYEEQLSKLENLYDDIWDKKDEISKKTKYVENEMKALEPIIKNVSEKLNNLNTYRIEELLKLVNKISNMSAKEKRIMQFLMSSKIDL